jgi:hypothetical protein
LLINAGFHCWLSSVSLCLCLCVWASSDFVLLFWSLFPHVHSKICLFMSPKTCWSLRGIRLVFRWIWEAPSSWQYSPSELWHFCQCLQVLYFSSIF